MHYLFQFLFFILCSCRSADKCWLARPGNKLQRQKILVFIYPIYIIIGGILVLFMYITRLASNEIFSPSNKIHREVGRAKDLSAHKYSHADDWDFCQFFSGVFIRMKPDRSIRLQADLVTFSWRGGGTFCLLKVWNARDTCVRVKSRPASTAVADVHQSVFDVTGYGISWQPGWILSSTPPVAQGSSSLTEQSPGKRGFQISFDFVLYLIFPTRVLASILPRVFYFPYARTSQEQIDSCETRDVVISLLHKHHYT
jgi:hypothetical protein